MTKNVTARRLIVFCFALVLCAGCGASTRVANPLAGPPAPPSTPTPAPAATTAEDAFEAGAAMEGENLDLADSGLEPEEGAPSESAPLAETAQKALDLCQLAEEQSNRGEMAEAISSVDRAYALMLALPNNGEDSYLQAKQDIRRLVARTVMRLYDRGAPENTPLTSWDLALPLVNNDHVRREIVSLTTVERDQFYEGYRRSGLFRPMILSKLQEAGLPSHLSWLPLVESWFKVRALSRAGAFGLWQFIASTGMRYGLSRDRWIDERLDPEKSTDAAIAYLTELHRLFGDWPKALAAYNCGEMRLLKLQSRSLERYFDFWDLYEHLPFETRRYVPRLVAALLIIEDPARYGMTLPSPLPAVDDWTVVSVNRAVELDRLDQALGMEKGTLGALNPELRHGATPKREYKLRVPEGKKDLVAASVSALPEWSPPVPQYAVHRVRRGETLSQIARRYRTSISTIMRVNRIRSANRIWPGQRLRIPLARSRGEYR